MKYISFSLNDPRSLLKYFWKNKSNKQNKKNTIFYLTLNRSESEKYLVFTIVCGKEKYILIFIRFYHSNIYIFFLLKKYLHQLPKEVKMGFA